MTIAIYRAVTSRSLSAAGLPLALAGYCIALLLLQIVSQRMTDLGDTDVVLHYEVGDGFLGLRVEPGVTS